MARIGYARVSSLDQDLDGQLARLQAEGCTIVRSEKVSGASREGRPELATVLQFLRAGDELVVARLDRLGRDTRDVLNLIDECEQRGASVTVLDPHVSTRGEMGHIVITVLGMVAQMERRFIKERQREGIARAKAEGRYAGGTRRIDRAAVLASRATGASVASIATRLGCSRMQVYRVLKGCNLDPSRLKGGSDPRSQPHKTDTVVERATERAIVVKTIGPRQAGLFDIPPPRWIKPCLPTLVDKPPIGPQWDGYCV